LFIAHQSTWETVHELIFAQQSVYGFTDQFGLHCDYHIEMLLCVMPSQAVLAELNSHWPYHF
jgi:hypothetical protein